MSEGFLVVLSSNVDALVSLESCFEVCLKACLILANILSV